SSQDRPRHVRGLVIRTLKDLPVLSPDRLAILAELRHVRLVHQIKRLIQVDSQNVRGAVGDYNNIGQFLSDLFKGLGVDDGSGDPQRLVLQPRGRVGAKQSLQQLE